MLDVQGLSRWPVIRRCGAVVGLVVALFLSSAGPAQAQRFGTMRQAFGTCNLTFALPITMTLSTLPSAVMLIGNAATMNKRLARAWGIAGGVMAGVGLTAEMSLLVGVTATRSSSPCDGTFAVMGIISFAIHLTTAGLSMANIVQSEQRIIRTLRMRRKARIAEWRRHRRERLNPKPTILTPLPPGASKKSKAKKSASSQLACQHIFSLYRATLNDALTAEDKDQSEALLDKLESQYDYCFKTYEGKLFLQQRKTILQGIQPRLPRDAPLPSVDPRRPVPRRRVVTPTVRKAPARPAVRPRPRAITRRAPPQRRKAPPKRRGGIPDSILNQIAAGKMPVARRRATPKKGPARRFQPRNATPRRKAPSSRAPARRTTTPPPADRTPPRGWLLRLEL